MAGKYRSYVSQKGISREERNAIHPIWRGIGFVFMILIPIMGYAASEVLLDLNGKNNWFPLPYDLLARPGQFLYSLIPDPMLYIKALITLIFIALFYAIFTLFSFVIIGSFGSLNNKRDPYYVPPVTRRKRKRF